VGIYLGLSRLHGLSDDDENNNEDHSKEYPEITSRLCIREPKLEDVLWAKHTKTPSERTQGGSNSTAREFEILQKATKKKGKTTCITIFGFSS